MRAIYGKLIWYSGKQTLTKLASFISLCKFGTVEIRKNFNQVDFRDRIKELMADAGIEGNETLFFLNDNHIIEV
jgi:dynein heavy chain, axonemal